MKKKTVLILLAAAALTLSACGNKEKAAAPAAETASEEAAEDAEDDADASSDDTTADTPEKKATGDAVVTDFGTVILADYIGLEADLTVYKITDEDVDAEIENLLQEYTEYENTTEGAAADDIVYSYFTATADDGSVVLDYSAESGENEDGEPYDFYLGYEEFGAEFDEKLTGCKAGDSFNITVSLDDDFTDETMAGKTVTFAGTVERVERPVLPELNDAFIKDTLGYESEAAMRAALKETLAEDNGANAVDETKENLMQQVISGSTFEEYNPDFYQSAYDSVVESYQNYMGWFGYEDLDAFLNDMGITKESLDEEALNETYRGIVVAAIAQKEKLTPSDQEFKAALEDYAVSYGYEDGDSLLKEYGEDSINQWIMDSKVLDFLYENAKITEVEGSLADEEMLMDEEDVELSEE